MKIRTAVLFLLFMMLMGCRGRNLTVDDLKKMNPKHKSVGQLRDNYVSNVLV